MSVTLLTELNQVFPVLFQCIACHSLAEVTSMDDIEVSYRNDMAVSAWVRCPGCGNWMSPARLDERKRLLNYATPRFTEVNSDDQEIV